MNESDAVSKAIEQEMPSKLKTLAWLGVGVAVYLFIQWMMPKVGMSS